MILVNFSASMTGNGQVQESSIKDTQEKGDASDFASLSTSNKQGGKKFWVINI